MTISPTIHRVDSSIVHYKESELGLASRLTRDAFSFLIIDLKEFKQLALAQYAIPEGFSMTWLNTLKETEPLLSFRYAQNWFSDDSHPLSTLIPDSLFRQDDLGTYAELSFGRVDTKQIILSDPCPAAQSQVVSLLPAMHLNIYRETLNVNADYVSSYASLIRAFQNIAKSIKRRKHCVCIDVQAQWATLIIFEHRKLQFINTFSSIQGPDLIRYILLALNRLHVDSGGIQLNVSGEASYLNEFIDLMDPYFDRIVQVPEAENYTLLNLCHAHH